MLTAHGYKLTRRKILAYLDELSATTEQAFTLYLPAQASETEVDAYLKQIPTVSSVISEVSAHIVSSVTGSVLFWGTTQKRLIYPPFPIEEKCLTNGYDISYLKTLLTRDCRIGIILVRLGSFSIGICEGESIVVHKTGTGLVHGRHRQGGSSSARFQRRRQDQADHFLKRVAAHIEERFAPDAKTLDYIVYGGARTTIDALRKHSRFLEQFDDRLLSPLLTIPDPRYEVLEKATTEIWSSKVIEWREKRQVD